MSKAARETDGAATDPGALGEYSAFLERRRLTTPGLKRSERTRLTLLTGAARALNATGLRLATVETIVQAAGLGHSTFYLHFPSKNAIAASVLLSFLDDMEATSRHGPRPRDDYDRAYLATLHYLQAFRANPGLARGLLQLDDEDDAVLSEAQARFGSAWYARSAQMLLKHFPTSRANQTQLMFAISAMGGMVDDFLRRWVVAQHSDLGGVVAAASRTDEEVAEALTCLWWRALVGPPPRAETALAQALADGAGGSPPSTAR